MAIFNGDIPAAIIYAPLTSHLFVPQDDTVEIWEVSITSSHILFEKKPLITLRITSICLLYDGYRVLVGSWNRIVSMWDMNLVRNQAVIMNTQDDVWKFITISPSRKIVAI